MKTVGIIAEYNPFHNGHAYQLEEARRLSGADYVIVVMSPDFVQRGEPALIDKWVRAEAALSCGADLVIELPIRYACASAEFFARGGVTLLSSLGVVNAISFGCETADFDALKNASSFFAGPEPEAYRQKLQDLVRSGKTYAQARAEAYLSCSDLTIRNDPETIANILCSPNNILAIEYLKAIASSGSSMETIPVLRKGSGYHDNALDSDYCSASAIRMALRNVCSKNPADSDCDSNQDPACDPNCKHEDYYRCDSIRHSMPDAAFHSLSGEIRCNRFVFPDDFSLLLHAALLNHKEHLTDYSDISSDLANRICHLMGAFTGFDQFAALMKSKQYTETRIRRSLLHVLLNLKERPAPVSYARILGFRRSAEPVLHAIKEASSIPLITKLPQTDIPEGLQEDIKAADLWELVLSHKTGQPMKNEYQRKIIIR